MKVKDLAKELGQNIEGFMTFLKDVDIRVKSPSAKLNPKTVRVIKDLFKEKPHGENEEEAPKEQRTATISPDPTTVGELAKLLNVPLGEIMQAILQKGLLLNLNSEINADIACEIALELDIDCTIEGTSTKETEATSLKDKLTEIDLNEMDSADANLQTRPPVITIMGHVDHGKTQLLDAIRKTNVVEAESGGITQHIGAYQIKFEGKKLTFLDTPGHEAFTSLRSRGAQVTDIAILVVAADEGVKPQTIEALNHAKAAGVSVIVALNKIDKPNLNIDQIKKELADHELLAEDWGGKTVMSPVSAKTGQGLEDLLNVILLEAEMQDLQANTNGPAQGVVIESELHKQKGAVATLLVKSGTLKKGDTIVSGTTYGKVKALINDRGEKQKKAGPGTPVEILGFNEAPAPGELFKVVNSEKIARDLVSTAKQNQKQDMNQVKQVSLETLSQQVESGDIKKLNLIVKSDVHGSGEAIIASIEKLKTNEVGVNILHSGVGAVTENDITLAQASEAVIIAFNLAEDQNLINMAEEQGVSIKYYKIIYEIIEDIQRAAEGMYTIEYEEEVQGEAEVRDIFSFSKLGKIAGSYVTSGKILRNSQMRVQREGEQIFEGKCHSLKRFKDDVKEVASGYECGIVLTDFDDLKENDVIVSFILKEKKRSL